MTTPIVKKFAHLLDQDPSLQPRRIVTRSGKRPRGDFTSHRFQRFMPWESPIEYKAINRAEASWSITDAISQPLKIQVSSLIQDGHRFRLHPRSLAGASQRPLGMRRMQDGN